MLSAYFWTDSIDLNRFQNKKRNVLINSSIEEFTWLLNYGLLWVQMKLSSRQMQNKPSEDSATQTQMYWEWVPSEMFNGIFPFTICSRKDNTWYTFGNDDKLLQKTSNQVFDWVATENSSDVTGSLTFNSIHKAPIWLPSSPMNVVLRLNKIKSLSIR